MLLDRYHIVWSVHLMAAELDLATAHSLADLAGRAVLRDWDIKTEARVRLF